MLTILAGLISPAMAGGGDRPISGVLAASNGPVSAGPMGAADGTMRTLAVGNKVYYEDEIVTGEGVRAQILLRDGTTFSIGEGARLVLDEFVFDPRSNAGGVGVVIKKGAFRFVSGKIAKANPRNMRVLAGNTAIAVRGTEVIGTVGGGAESVILISGQVDLVSIGGDCVASGSGGGGGGDMFGIGADGGLEFNADVVAAPPDYCNRSLVRAGFGVQVAGGQIATPGRIDTATIDAVIDAITIKESIEETSQQQSEQPAPAEEEAAEAGLAETGETSQSGDAATEPELATAEPEAEIEPAVLPVQETAGAAEPSPEAEESLSEFDKVVMRAFGLLDEEKPASEAVGDARSEPQGQLVMAAGLAAEGPDDDKADGAATEDSGQNEVKLDDQVEDTPTEEEKRNEIKVEEAVLELNKPTGETDSSEPSQTTNTNTNPSNNAPTLAAISGIAFSDSANDDSFTLVSATLTGSDSDSGDTLTYSVSGGSADTSVSGFTHSRTGSYGTLYVNSSSGAYRYVPNDSAIEGLTSNASEDFTLSVSDGAASASQTLTASITGVNDTPVLSAITGFTLTDTANNDSFTNQAGSLSTIERDASDTLTYSLSGASADTSVSGFTHSRAGSYGTLYVNSSSGAYRYVPNDSAIEGLTSNASEDFTLSVSDGAASASQTLTASITGVNDTPVLSAITGFTLTDTASDDSFSNQAGTLSGSERDSGDTLTYAISGGSADTSVSGFTHSRTGSYGTLYVNSGSGAYRYVPNDTAIERLTSSTSEDFTLSVSDGTASASQTLTASIAGANDTPILSSVTGFTLADTSGDDSFSNQAGTLSGSERDSGDTLAYSVSGGSADTSVSGFTHSRAGSYGTLYVNSGTGAYRFVPNDSAIEGLTSNASEDFTLSVSDGTASASQTLTASFTGVNDAPILSSITGFTLTDTSSDDSFSNQAGSLSTTERDSSDTLTYAISGASADTSVSGFTHSRAGSYGTLYIDSGTGAYRYVPNDAAIEGLKSNASEDFTLSVSDGTASASQTLTASITGADDTLTVAALSGITLTDTANDDSFSTSTGAVAATERDTADTVSYAISGGSADTSVSGFTHSRLGTYGTLFINSGTGAYQFVPADTAIERATATVTEDFTVSVTSGGATVNETLTATVAGVNDTPVFNAISAITLTDTTADDSFTKGTGTLSANERDSGQSITFSATGQQTIPGDPNFTHGVQGTYGTLAFNSSTGDYEYTPTDSLVNAVLNDTSETFTFSASDSALSANQTLTINITGADDGPSAIDTYNLAREGGTQNVSASGLRLGVVTDPEGDAVTDLTSTLNALPAWLSFGNQTLGDGTVQYYWEVGANEAPWRAGTKAMDLKARSSGIDTAATSFSITFTCQSSHCNDFLQSSDTETSPAVYDPGNINQILTGMKIGGEDFLLLSAAERNALFDTSVTANGSFRVIYSSAETGSGSPTGTWGIDQTVNVDYKMRTIDVSGSVSASNIGYIDGASDDFTYTNSMSFSDTALGADSVFAKPARTSSNSGYDLQNSGNTVIHIQLDDQIGFMVDTNGQKAAVINTNIRPLSTNPAGYNDDTNNLVQQKWRLLEPQ